MLGFRPLASAPISSIDEDLLTESQTVTLRYASQSFVSRANDTPALTFLAGRIARGVTMGRRLSRGPNGQFGGLIESVFGELELVNDDGALDALISDYFADGRAIRLKIGATEIVQPTRIMPEFVAEKHSPASGDASSAWTLNYPDDGIIPGDFFLAQITINDRGQAGALPSIPTGWTAIAQDTNSELHQALLYKFADGDEAGTSESIEWESGDTANDVIIGRIRQFRYVDPDDPIDGLVALITGSLETISLPSITTEVANSLAIAAVSWSDNVDTMGPTGESGGNWDYVGGKVSATTADDAANRVAAAEIESVGTISGGSITVTPTDSPPTTVSMVRGFALRGLTSQGGQERVQALSDFALVYTATAGPWSLEKSVMRLSINDLGSKLQERIQTLTYAGTGSENGTSDIAGRSRPLCFGHCLNVSAQLVDPTELIFQVHSGTIEAIDAVYDQGASVPFTGSPSSGQDYATYAALEAASVPNGVFSTCLAEGYFKLGETPVGTVTADVRGDNAPVGSPSNYVNTHAGVIKRVLTGYSQLTLSDLGTDSFDTLDTDQPAEIGLFLPAGDDSTIAAVIERIAQSCGAFAGDRSGSFRVQRLEAPATTQHWSFNDRTIISIEREIPGYGIPWKSWGIGYQRNWTVQGSDIAVGVTQARRQFLQSEFRFAFDTSATIALAHQTSVGVLRDTLFHDSADASAEATRLLSFYSLGRTLYRVVVKTALFSVHIGQTVHLTYNRWDLSSGKRFVVVGVADDADTRESELLVFG